MEHTFYSGMQPTTKFPNCIEIRTRQPLSQGEQMAKKKKNLERTINIYFVSLIELIFVNINLETNKKSRLPKLCKM